MWSRIRERIGGALTARVRHRVRAWRMNSVQLCRADVRARAGTWPWGAVTHKFKRQFRELLLPLFTGCARVRQRAGSACADVPEDSRDRGEHHGAGRHPGSNEEPGSVPDIRIHTWNSRSLSREHVIEGPQRPGAED